MPIDTRIKHWFMVWPIKHAYRHMDRIKDVCIVCGKPAQYVRVTIEDDRMYIEAECKKCVVETSLIFDKLYGGNAGRKSNRGLSKL